MNLGDPNKNAVFGNTERCSRRRHLSISAVTRIYATFILNFRQAYALVDQFQVLNLKYVKCSI
jgi:hypothetical protein